MHRSHPGLGRTLVRTMAALAACSGAAHAMPVYDHVVVVVEENHGYSQIVGSTYAPYFNSLVAGGASLTKMYGEEHHSQGNYHWLFSGGNQNIGYNDPGVVGPFANANLGSELIASGRTFRGYSEDLPSIGSTVNTSGQYARKHNPWVAFSNVPNGTTMATSSNVHFADFPSDFTQLPTVSVIVPNQDHDMHNGSDPGSITTGDAWLSSNIGTYATWARTHNSLLIVTFDEGQGSTTGLTNPTSGTNANRIATVFTGANILPGSYAEGAGATHVNLLRTLEDLYGLGHAGAQQPNATAAGISNASISDVFVSPEPATLGSIAGGLIVMAARRRRV